MKFGENFRKFITGTAIVAGGALASEKVLAQENQNQKTQIEQTSSTPELSEQNEKTITESLKNLATKLVQEGSIKLDTDHYDGFMYVGTIGKYEVKFSDHNNDKKVDLGNASRDWVAISYEDDKKIKYSVMKNVSGVHGSARSETEQRGLTKMSKNEFRATSGIIIHGDDSIYARMLSVTEMEQAVNDVAKTAEANTQQKNANEKIEKIRSDIDNKFH